MAHPLCLEKHVFYNQLTVVLQADYHLAAYEVENAVVVMAAGSGSAVAVVVVVVAAVAGESGVLLQAAEVVLRLSGCLGSLVSISELFHLSHDPLLLRKC